MNVSGRSERGNRGPARRARRCRHRRRGVALPAPRSRGYPSPAPIGECRGRTLPLVVNSRESSPVDRRPVSGPRVAVIRSRPNESAGRPAPIVGKGDRSNDPSRGARHCVVVPGAWRLRTNDRGETPQTLARSAASRRGERFQPLWNGAPQPPFVAPARPCATANQVRILSRWSRSSRIAFSKSATMSF